MADSGDKRHLHRYVPANPSHRPTTLSELAILQKHHRFIRDDDDAESSKPLSWEDKLAHSWYQKLFREFALCDLSRYKEGEVALRWRVEQEVLDGIGELTCGSLHCKHHLPTIPPSQRFEDDERPLVSKDLEPYQLDFRYQERGETKNALVKVVLCDRCKRKLTWKKDREKEAALRAQARQREASPEERASRETVRAKDGRGYVEEDRQHRSRRRERDSHKFRGSSG